MIKTARKAKSLITQNKEEDLQSIVNVNDNIWSNRMEKAKDSHIIMSNEEQPA